MHNIANLDLWRTTHATACRDLKVRELHELIANDESLDLRALIVRAVDDYNNAWWIEYLLEKFMPLKEWEAFCARRAQIFGWMQRALTYHWHMYWDKKVITEANYFKLIADTNAYYRARFRTYLLTELIKE